MDFKTIKTEDNRMLFIKDKITIAVGNFLYNNGKHQIADPYAANAHLVCFGKVFTVTNSEGIDTVEDWYIEELLPKFQMLYLLETVMPK